MNISHIIAIFLLFLAAVTWLFDKELKRKSERCAAFCEAYEPPRESSFSSDQDDDGAIAAPEPRYISCGCDGSASPYTRRGFGR